MLEASSVPDSRPALSASRPDAPQVTPTCTANVVPDTFVPEEELSAILATMDDVGTGLFAIVPAGVGSVIAGDAAVAVNTELESIVRQAGASGRPMTFMVGAAGDRPVQAVARRLCAATDGARLRPQVSKRCFGELIGHQLKVNAFQYRPTHRALEHLPLAERVRRMRDPETGIQCERSREVAFGDHVNSRWVLGVLLVDRCPSGVQEPEARSEMAELREARKRIRLLEQENAPRHPWRASHAGADLALYLKKSLGEEPAVLRRSGSATARGAVLCDGDGPSRAGAFGEYWGAMTDDSPVSADPGTAVAPLETHVFATTLMPRGVMERFYAPLVASLPSGPVRYRAMTEAGGLGRTDLVLAAMRPGLERARARGARLRLVGHSLGGVVAWALAHEFTDIVDEVELYGTPVRGTALTGTRLPVAEARFLARASRWLRAYDRPLDGPVVRSVYSACDFFVSPPRPMSAVEGERAENYFVVPVPLPRRFRRADEHLHQAVVGHVGLPRHQGIQARLRRPGHHGVTRRA